MATSKPRVVREDDSEILSPLAEVPQPKSRKSYTVKRKLEAIAKYDENGGNVAKASRESNVTRGCLQQWLKQRDELDEMRQERKLSIRKQRKRSLDDTVAATRGEFPEIETRLVEWLASMRQDGVTVSGECIKLQARATLKEEAPDKDPEEFKASNGWLHRFTKRHKISFRAVTSQGQKIPDDAKTLACL